MSRRSKREELVDFAVVLQREINVRSATFAPATEQEHMWARLGLCEIFELTTFQDALGTAVAA